MKICNND